MWDPRKGKFNVTDKGGVLEAGYLDLKAVAPNLVLHYVSEHGYLPPAEVVAALGEPGRRP